MAGPIDPWMPGLIDPAIYEQARQQVTGFLDDPQGRAALLSAGLSLMQPPSFGDSPVSQIGRAIGAAGQSATANQNMQLREEEAQSKQDLRASQGIAAEARASAAEARAGAAGARLGAQQDRLELSKERMRMMQDRNLLNNRVRLSGMYQQYVKDVAKRNSDPLRTGTPEPVLPMADWIKSNPMLSQLGLLPDTQPVSSSEDEEVPTTSPPTTSSQAKQFPGAPAIGEVRKGYRYNGGDPKLQSSWSKV